MAISKKSLKQKYEWYKRSSDYSLDDAYGRYSSAKAKAWEYCMSLCASKNGSGLKVISHNSNMFTAGFEFEENGVLKFMYITKSEDTEWEVE